MSDSRGNRVSIVYDDDDDNFIHPHTTSNSSATNFVPQYFIKNEKNSFFENERSIKEKTSVTESYRPEHVEKKNKSEFFVPVEKKVKKSKVIPFTKSEPAAVSKEIPRYSSSPNPKLTKKKVSAVIVKKPSEPVTQTKKVSSQHAISIFERNSNSGALRKPPININENAPLTEIASILGITDSFQIPLWFQPLESSKNIISNETARNELYRFIDNPVFEE
jgi:hypothetical protein